MSNATTTVEGGGVFGDPQAAFLRAIGRLDVKLLIAGSELASWET